MQGVFFGDIFIGKSPCDLPFKQNDFFMKLKNVCVCKLGIPRNHIIDGSYICTSLWPSVCKLWCNFHPHWKHLHNSRRPWVLFLHYIYTVLFDWLPLVIIQICQLTAGDKFLDDLHVKISVTTISDHLRPENTIITKGLVRKLNNNLL